MDKVSHEKKTVGKGLYNQTPQLIEWRMSVVWGPAGRAHK